MNEFGPSEVTRRGFVKLVGAAGAAAGMSHAIPAHAQQSGPPVDEDGEVIPGFEESETDPNAAAEWTPFSDRKIRVGIAGYGLCRFGAAFGFQNHPNVEVVAVTDLIPHRRAALAEACGCRKTFASCEEMIKDGDIEAVFIATDAPSHARLAIAAMEHGKHVACCVPAVHGSLEDADRLFETVKRTGMKYMMFETSCFHAELYANHQRYQAGQLGRVIYTEGEYYHYFGTPLGGYNPKTGEVDPMGWRNGLPPQWYPTHATAYYVGVTGGSFTEVSCMGMPSVVPHLQAGNNEYENPFGSEIALFRTSEGGMARMAVCWDLPSAGGERGRVYGQKADDGRARTTRPPLPPGVPAGGHGGSHGHLTTEFVDAVLRDRKPWIDVAQSLNMTVAGIVAHRSALEDGELMKIPQYSLG